MKIAIIGRSEVLYETTIQLLNQGHDITCILTAKEAPEYTRKSDDFKSLAEELGIPFASGANIIKSSEFLTNSKSEIAVSINFSGIIPQSIIDIFPLGILNAHGGDLPKYRGNACQAWALINGEDKIGLCIHKMIGGELDNGDIVARDYLPVNINTRIGDVLSWIMNTTPNLVIESISQLQKNSDFILEIQSKDPIDALRCYPRMPHDGLIDWSKSNNEILRLINASSQPYSGAYCNFGEDKIIIWKADLVDDDEVFCATPGQLTKITKSYVEIACGEGKLSLIEIELNQKITSPGKIFKSIRQRLN